MINQGIAVSGQVKYLKTDGEMPGGGSLSLFCLFEAAIPSHVSGLYGWLASADLETASRIESRAFLAQALAVPSGSSLR